MLKKNICLLFVMFIVALVCLVAPVAADKYVVTSSSSSPTAGDDITITAQLSYDNGTAIATAGKTVTWTRSPSSGIFSAQTSLTSSSGIATVTFTTGETGGIAYTITATDDDLTTGTSAAITTVAAVSTPAISGVTPPSATNGGSQTVVIEGSGFISGATVNLTKSGESTIDGTPTGTDSALNLSRTFALNGVTTGTWTLNVLNSDGGTTSTSFTVSSATAATVTSINPVSGIANDTVSVTIGGSGFTAADARIRLYKSGNYLIGSVNSGGSSIQLTGSFDLDDATPAIYDVCVLADGSEASKECGPTFTVIPEYTANGSIYFTSSPSGATVYVDSVEKGTTPFTLENVIPDSYNIKMQRTSYLDWADRIEVTAGNETTVSATLSYQSATTAATPVPTTIFVSTATLPPTTVKSSLAAPTPWPSDTPTPESSLSVLAIIGALAAGIVVLGRK